MLRHFFLVWLVYWAGIVLLPVNSSYPATVAAFMLQAVFVLLVALGYSVVSAIWKVPRMPRAGEFEMPSASALIEVSLLMSLIGLQALIFDKIFIQDIDFSNGLAVAREMWRQIAEQREGKASSVFSMIGYLFGSAYYVAVVLAITQCRFISSFERLWTFLVSFALLMANSVITGGRSNVLLLATFVISAFASRSDLALRDMVTSAFQRRCINLLIILAGAYTVFIFYQRASAGRQTGLEYALGFLPFLGLEVSEWYQGVLEDGTLSSLSAMLVLAVSYVTHSFATVAAIMDAPSEDKTIIFLHMLQILYKLGLTASPDGDWFLAGRMPSVPGALWHQWGALGFVICSLFLGMMSAASKIWSARRPHYLLPLGAYVTSGSILLLTPVLFAGDFLSFPFVVGAFLMLSVFGYIIRSDSCRTETSRTS